MNDIDRRWLLAGAGILGVTALTRMSRGGPLNPPAGPVASTGKTTTDIEPRTAINATNTPGDATCVFKITQSGSYYLTGNVTGAAAKSGILVTADNVSIDLNGFQIAGSSGSGVGAIKSTPTNIVFSSLTVRNGTLIGSGFNDYAMLSNHGNSRANDVTFLGTVSARSLVLTHCSVRGFAAAEDLVADSSRLETLAIATSAVIRGSVLAGGTFASLEMNDCVCNADFSVTSSIAKFVGCNFFKVRINADGVTVTLDKCSFGGGMVSANRVHVTDCDFVGASFYNWVAIHALDGGLVDRCTFKGYSFAAIRSYNAITVTNCTIRDCLNDATAVMLGGAGNRVAHNILDNNIRGIMTLSATVRGFIANNILSRHPGGSFINTADLQAATFISVQALNASPNPSPFANIADGP